jgi:hypothetical protein
MASNDPSTSRESRAQDRPSQLMHDKFTMQELNPYCFKPLRSGDHLFQQHKPALLADFPCASHFTYLVFRFHLIYLANKRINI